MAGAWGQRQSDGTAPRLADGTTPRTTADTACCCGGTSTCPFCDAPLPTAYDFEFTGVTMCPGEPALYTTVTVDVYVHDPVTPSCSWSSTTHVTSLEEWNCTSGHFSTGAGVSYQRVVYNAPFTPIVHPYFNGFESPYGPDCSVTILLTNTYTNCISSSAHGGSATGVAVMPP